MAALTGGASTGSLRGKVALVTGGSRGIGAAIAKRLAQEGADVAITYVSTPEKAQAVAKDIEATGRRGLAIAADSADPRAIVEAVERTVRDLGRIDILVNNAGIARYGPLDSLTLDDVDQTLAIHVRASFLAAQAAARHMKEGSRIINLSSCQADRVAFEGATLYAMSKAALNGLTRGLSRDLGPRGITAVSVHPGPIDTDMNPANGPSADMQRGLTALGHFGTGEDVAATVAHLAGDAGRYITGTSITIDGGTNA